MLNRLTDNLNFQTQALSLRSERQRMLASNIANADTPGYQARDMNFAKALRDATAGAQGPGSLVNTQSGHMASASGTRSDSEMLYSTAAQTNLDSNSVDMDRERANFADNAVKYEATLRFINGTVRTTLDAMKSPNAA